jgi:hypothetical protein
MYYGSSSSLPWHRSGSMHTALLSAAGYWYGEYASLGHAKTIVRSGQYVAQYNSVGGDTVYRTTLPLGTK